jgi:hypothetical protein
MQIILPAQQVASCSASMDVTGTPMRIAATCTYRDSRDKQVFVLLLSGSAVQTWALKSVG